MVRLVSDLSNEHRVRLFSGICLMPKRGDELLIDGRDFDRSAGFRSICRIPINRMTPQVPGYGSLPCHLGYFHAIKLGIRPPIKYCLGGCLSVGNVYFPLIIWLPGRPFPSIVPHRMPDHGKCIPRLLSLPGAHPDHLRSLPHLSPFVCTHK